jgi:glycosyltransferase involved in cell wall biosynthesis
MNLKKFRVVGDPQNPARFSSNIITTSLNKAAKNLGLYDENGLTVVYDCIGNNHGYKADALIVCYELAFPDYVVKNCGDTPIICVSKDNLRFAIDGGCNPEKCAYINLGVDTNVWKPVVKNRYLDKFVVLSYTESLVRSGLEILVDSFELAFKHLGYGDKLLYIKDRNATEEFQEWITQTCKEKGIPLKYENRHISTVDEEREVYASADCHVYLNRSTTWGMTVCQSMACGVPTISPCYSGPREYIVSYFSGIGCEYDYQIPDYELAYLKSIVQRNFFFPFRNTDFWCKPNKENVALNIQTLYNSKALRQKISKGGIAIANNFTWERSALMLSESLERICK